MSEARPMSHVVVLGPSECKIAANIGCHRQIQNLFKNARPAHGVAEVDVWNLPQSALKSMGDLPR